MPAPSNLGNIPKDPGVYLFKKKEKVIYIGKAKSLKKKSFILLSEIKEEDK